MQDECRTRVPAHGATNFENADRPWICIAAGFLPANKPRGPLGRVFCASTAWKINVLIVVEDKKQRGFLAKETQGLAPDCDVGKNVSSRKKFIRVI